MLTLQSYPLESSGDQISSNPCNYRHDYAYYYGPYVLDPYFVTVYRIIFSPWMPFYQLLACCRVQLVHQHAYWRCYHPSTNRFAFIPLMGIHKILLQYFCCDFWRTRNNLEPSTYLEYQIYNEFYQAYSVYHW